MIESVSERMEKYLGIRQLIQNSLLIRQGDPPQGLFIIASGQVTVELEHGDGKTTAVKNHGEGTIIGELGLLFGLQGFCNGYHKHTL